MKASELNISLLYRNVCGLKSKLNIPKFNYLDLLYCHMCRNKMDDLDVLNIDKFEVVQKNRNQKVIRKSGGIAVLI